MKNAYRLSVLLMALAVCVINVYTKTSPAQGESDSKKNEEIQYKLSVENETIQSGQPIKITLTLENDTSETIQIVESVGDIRMTITDQAGAPVPMIGQGSKFFGYISVRRVIRKVEPGTKVRTTFAINEMYKLDPGTYSISATRWINGMKKGMPKEIQSNTIKIKIVS